MRYKNFKARAANPVTLEQVQEALAGSGQVAEQKSGVLFYIFDNYLEAEASRFFNPEKRAAASKEKVLTQLRGKFNVSVAKENVIVRKGFTGWGGGRRPQDAFKTPQYACGNIYKITPIAEDSEDRLAYNQIIQRSTDAANELLKVLDSVAELKAELLTYAETYSDLRPVGNRTDQFLRALTENEKTLVSIVQGLRDNIQSGDF